MKYFEVELENPDEFLKLQTEDFVKANRLLLRKLSIAEIIEKKSMKKVLLLDKYICLV